MFRAQNISDSALSCCEDQPSYVLETDVRPAEFGCRRTLMVSLPIEFCFLEEFRIEPE